MRKSLLIFAALSAVSVSLVAALSADDKELLGYCFGLALFSANLGILGFLAKRLLSPATESHSTKATANPLFLALVPLKFVLIGGGAYLALVPLDLSPWFFVGGAAAGLAFVTVAFAAKTPRHFSALT